MKAKARASDRGFEPASGLAVHRAGRPKPHWSLGIAVILASAMAGLVACGQTSIGVASDSDTVSAPGALDNEGADIDVAPVPSKDEFERNRQRAAQESVADDEARAQEAEEWYSNASKSAADTQVEMLVSLSEPVALSTVIKAFADRESELRSVFLWVSSPGALHPVWGESNLSRLRVSGSAAVSSITESYTRYLTQRISSLRGDSGRDAEDDAARRAQAASLDDFRKQLEETGLMTFGFTCDCSPSGLSRGATTSSIEIKLVEPADKYYAPLFPEDNLRDSLVGMQGR